MALKYCTFDQSEYACLHPELSCVRSILDLMQHDREIKELEEQLTRAELAVKTQGKGLQRALLKHMKEFDAETVEERVLARINLYRSLLSRTKNTINERELHRVADNLYTDFAKLDSKAFEEFFKTHFADEIAASVEVGKDVQSVRAKLTHARGRRDKTIADAIENDFKAGVPERFRDRTIGLDMTQEQMAEMILMAFYRDWKDRAVLFEVPVSVSGVGIYSMEEHRRHVWWRAYQAFGFDKLTRRPVYQYRVAPKESVSWSGPSVLRGSVEG